MARTTIHVGSNSALWEMTMAVLQVKSMMVHHEYLDAGSDPTGEPIVFVNSLGTDFRVWDQLLPWFVGERAIGRYDKRGHGLSSMTKADFSIMDLADDLAAIMQEWNMPPAIICGLSIGGMIAQSLASRHPDRVTSLILMDTGHRIGNKDMWQDRIARVELGGIEAIADQVMQRWFTERFRNGETAEAALWRNMLTRTPKAGYIACAKAISNADLTEDARSIGVPTLCLVGDQDGSTPPDLVRSLSELIKGSDFHVIEEAGHLPCIEQAETTARLIQTFLKNR